MPTLTTEQKKKYLANPIKCPFCKSKRVATYERKVTGKIIAVRDQCLNCNEFFTETYSLVDVEAG